MAGKTTDKFHKDTNKMMDESLAKITASEKLEISMFLTMLKSSKADLAAMSNAIPNCDSKCKKRELLRKDITIHLPDNKLREQLLQNIDAGRYCCFNSLEYQVSPKLELVNWLVVYEKANPADRNACGQLKANITGGIYNCDD